MNILTAIVIFVTILFIAVMAMYDQQKSMESDELDKALFRRIEEEWRE